jgi:hypothetical protein
MTTPSGTPFTDSLIAQGSGTSSASFPTGALSSKTPDPSAQGISKNVLGGSVNLGLQPIGPNNHLVGGDPIPASESVLNNTTVDTAARAFFGMSRDEIAAIQTRLVDAGYLTKIRAPGFIDPETAKAFGDLLQNASAYNTAGNPITINDFLNQSAQSALEAAKASAAMTGANSSEFKRETISLTNPDDARYLVNQSLQNHLGRKATPDEIAQFTNALNSSERASPSHETYRTTGPNTTAVSLSQPVSAPAQADAFALGSQGRADEAGAQSELGFLKVLQNLVGNTRSPV